MTGQAKPTLEVTDRQWGLVLDAASVAITDADETPESVCVEIRRLVESRDVSISRDAWVAVLGDALAWAFDHGPLHKRTQDEAAAHGELIALARNIERVNGWAGFVAQCRAAEEGNL